MVYKRIILSLLAITIGYIGFLGNASATILQAGDIFLFTVNAGNEDDIQLGTRVNIQSGTIIYLTDNAWNTNSGSRVNTEGFMSLTAIDNIPAGSVFTLISTGTNHTPNIISPEGGFSIEKISGTFALNNDGDTILVYQSFLYNSLPPIFIYGWGFSSMNLASMPWVDTSTPTTSNTSHIPSTLSGQAIFEINGHESLPVNDRKRNRKYNCSNTTINSTTFLDDLKNPANRSGEKIGNKFDVSSPGCSFTMGNFDEPILEINFASGQAEFTSGDLVRFQVESTQPLDVGSFTCDDIILTGEYDNASCIAINEVTTLDRTIFEVSIKVNLLEQGFGDITMDIIEGSVTSQLGVADIGSFSLSGHNNIFIDNQGPSITLTGSGSITLEIDSVWVDPGASCTDNRDSSCIITISGSVDTSTLGTYIIAYSATDEVGNTSLSIRSIEVVDTNSPLITLNGSNSITLEAGTPWVDPGASCTDNIDPLCTVMVSGSVNNIVPRAYSIEYSATDSDSNKSTIYRTVNVVDTTPPTIVLEGGDIYFEPGQELPDQGAYWSDIVDGTGKVLNFSGDIVNVNVDGIYTLFYRYIDSAGNSSEIISRRIVVGGNTSSPTDTPRNTGGGGYTLERDLCPNGDKSPSYHDGICKKEKKVDQTIFNSSIGNVCFTPRDIKTIEQGDNTSQQFKIAHQMLYSYGLTKWKGTQDYRPNDYITRQEAAKFMVQFAQNVLCREKTRTYHENFSDLGMSDVTLTNFIREAYEYNIFNGDKAGTFRPTDRIRHDELAAIMIRLVTNTFLEEPEGDWAREYKKMLTLYSKNSSLHNVQRDSLAEVIYDLYRNNSYMLQNIGYTIER